MTTTLTGLYASTVNLGEGSIGDTVSVTGTIQIGFYGDDGIFGGASISNAYINNIGLIRGGENGNPNGFNGPAGAGIYLAASGTVVNGDQIDGGLGGSNPLASAYGGGAGVSLNGGALTNNYQIAGGQGGQGLAGGNGGNGVTFNGTGAVSNYFAITGGAGGQGSAEGGYGGVGVSMTGGNTLTNWAYGAIVGGTAGYGGRDSGGIGVLLISGSSLTNYGLIEGGSALYIGATQGGSSGGAGLEAVESGPVRNGGTINGGTGAESIGGTASQGGTGVLLASATYLANHGSIGGGAGGYGSGAKGVGGIGGTGLSVTGSGAPFNGYSSGSILGGAGGKGGLQGGAGGAGVYLAGGTTLTNLGTIIGGDGGPTLAAGGVNGAGGVGVYLNGAMLTNAGTIIGGTDGTFLADAISFGRQAATLVLEPNAVVTGAVQANAADTLDLAGQSPGAISGLDGQFLGFGTINVDASALWNLNAANGASATQVLNVDGTLVVTDDFEDAATTIVAGGGSLKTSGNGILETSNLILAGGGITCAAQGVFAVDTTFNGAIDGAITIDAGATLAGYGAILSPLAGSGTLDATKSTLAVHGSVGGSVTLTAASGGTLALFSGGGLGKAASGAGTLQLNGATPYVLAAASKVSIAAVVVEAKAVLDGTGAITSKLADAGTVSATSFTLSLGGAVTGNGVFSAAAGATLDFAGGVTTAGQIAGAGVVEFGAASTLGAGIKLGAAKVVQAANITLGSSASLTVPAGEAFSLQTGSGGTIKLSGAAGDKFSNAGSIAAGGTGTADISVAFVNASSVSAGSAAISFLGSVSNAGTMGTASGKLSFASEVTGTGTLAIGTGTLTLSDGASSGQSVQFQGLSGLLDLAHPSAFAGLIGDFGANDKIDLLNAAANGFKFAGGVLTIENGNSTVATLAFVGNYTQSDFAIGSDAHGGTFITFK